MGAPFDDLATVETPVAAYAAHLDEAAQAATATGPAVSTPIPVLVSHAATLLLMAVLGGVNAGVWAVIPGGEAAVVSVASLLVQAGVSALAAWWAHARVSPIPETSPRHAAPTY